MNAQLLVTVFVTVFVAEIGDKTQLATLLYAANSPGNKLGVFVAASLALILASAIAVLAGSVVSTYVKPRHLSIAAGLGFIAVGIWTLLRAPGS